MKKRVKLTRQLIQLDEHCSFVGKDHEDDQDRRKSMARRSTLRNSQFQHRHSRPSMSGSRISLKLHGGGIRGSRTSIFSVQRRSTTFSRASISSIVQNRSSISLAPLVASESSSPPKSPLKSHRSFLGLNGERSASISSLGRSSTRGSQPCPDSGSIVDNSDVREASASSGKTTTPKLPGRAHGRQWVDRRKEALKFAHWRRQIAQVRDGQLTEMLTPSEGYRATKAILGLPFASFTTAPETPRTPSSQRFRQAKSVYGKPVWHEVFGDPMAPMELPD